MSTTSPDLQQLEERLQFIGIDATARRTIRDLQATIMSSIGSALDAFYEKAGANAHTSRFFSDPAHVASAKKRQEAHWQKVSSAEFDAAYLSAISGVGQIHARLGLEPRWYIGGYALIIGRLIEGIVEKEWPSRFGKRRSKTLAAKLTAVVKIAMIDIDYGISVYLSALDAERKKAEELGRAREAQGFVVDSLSDGLHRLADGDLTVRLDEVFPERFEPIRNRFNAAVESLSGVLGTVVEATGSIRRGLDEISTASEDLSQRTGQQAAALEETTAALANVLQGIDATAVSAQEALDAATVARKNAGNGSAVVTRAIAAMSEIAVSSAEIGKIIGVIDEIAFQTNLLALNAGVEAARAGESGRGFAVVAQEVRGLAQRSAEAAKTIKGLISTSSSQVELGVKCVTESGVSLTEIVAGVSEMNRVVSEIALSARTQAASLKEVAVAAQQMDHVTQRNAAMVEETTAATQSLMTESESLAQLTQQFRLEAKAVPFAPASNAKRREPRPSNAAPRQAPRPMRSAAAKLAPRAAEDEWENF